MLFPRDFELLSSLDIIVVDVVVHLTEKKKPKMKMPKNGAATPKKRRERECRHEI
jgi:hypothetical protein